LWCAENLLDAGDFHVGGCVPKAVPDDPSRAN
jgi:hypothetical protein